MNGANERLRALPSVDALLAAAPDLIEAYGRQPVVEALRRALDAARQQIRADQFEAVDVEAHLLGSIASQLRADFQPSLRAVINATGVIIHTNLGRAPLSDAAQQAVSAVASSYNTLEYSLETGGRGSRSTHAEAALVELTGAEAALVVNNNASALLLILSGLAQGREVIISRGQLIEIGGGFRIPDVMLQSGARLVEVGTTNRTRIADFAAAISDQTALLLRAHYSNFRQIGFTEEARLYEMAELAHQHGLLVVDDVGSGALIDTALFGLEHEPTVQESIAAGVDVVCFSGDKLLGAPQAGIIVGKRDQIDRLRWHPLARAIRADKLCLAGLSATLDHYRRGEALTKIPVWSMITRPLESLRAAVERWQARVGGAVIDGQSTIGGGSLPGETLPTALLALTVAHPNTFAARLRAAETPVIARVADDRVLFDPRTILPGQEDTLLTIIQSTLQQE
jgi:L-seryl-tRNA(Ser) seleniumtransferase